MKHNTKTNTATHEQHSSFAGVSDILWDFNGTLLNDTQLCINSMNELLVKRNLNPLDIDYYREIFTFPVKEYYRKAGFDFDHEPFEKPALEFIDLYEKNLKNYGLYSEVIEVLDHFHKTNRKQFIISAMQQDSLEATVISLGIAGYFQEVHGISNHYAHGKTESAGDLIKKHDLNPANICLIGDTLHDHEVAGHLGCKCILVANGHQSYQRLAATGRLVLENLNQLKNYF